MLTQSGVLLCCRPALDKVAQYRDTRFACSVELEDLFVFALVILQWELQVEVPVKCNSCI